MCIDRLDWIDGKPSTPGPTWTDQPAPEDDDA
jgi:hypothetical protein